LREDACCTRQLSPGFGQEIMLALPLRVASDVLGGSTEKLLRTKLSEGSGRNAIERTVLPLSASIAGSARRLFAPVADDPTRHALREARAWLLICEVLAELKIANHANPTPSIKSGINGRTRLLVERAADLLLNRPSDKHTLQSVARAVGLSRSALAEAFRRHHDTTLNEFLWRERMRRAELLLESSQLSISEIAANVGYGDPSSFTRAFRRFREITPRKLRCEGFFSGTATA
jgi:AraC-like DNA-binding protein